MKHIYEQAAQANGTFISLHGTGGDEFSLQKMTHQVSVNMNYLGIRGNVDENGMARYFRRLREGVFDMDDLRFRTAELADFIREAAVTYGFSLDTSYLIGYSNGANIAANLMLTEQDLAAGALLLHPMVPSREQTAVDLAGKQLFISAGRQDPLVPMEEADELEQLFLAKNAEVLMYRDDHGHQISYAEVAAAGKWLEQVL